MKNTAHTNLSLIRCSWLAITIFVVIFCGPVKRLVELRLDDSGTATSQSIDKKLHTWYREKKEITPLVYHVPQPSPETGLTVFLITALFSFLLVSKGRNIFRPQYLHLPITAGMPLYLHINKLQV